MKVFIFMNEKIRKRKPDGPVIRVQRADSYEEANRVFIHGPSVVRFDPRGLPIAQEHHVTAWIEADERDVVCA
jgi:hypothetical protein